MAIGGQIRPNDKEKFAAAARKIGVWILVRGTNPKSLDYIGRADCVPKPIDCKAKTAKLGPNAGLVVDPFVASSAFAGPDLWEAQKNWKEKYSPLAFSPLAHRYSIEKTGLHKGAVKLDGKYIYGDYDLKAVVVPGHESATIALVTELRGVQNVRRGPKFYEVQSEVNNAIGVPMVQHGADDEFTAHGDETIYVFGPQGEHQELQGLAEIERWYNTQFHGRKTLDSKSPGGVPAGVTPGIRGVVQADGTIRPVNFGKR
jgi:hypothetical protein